MKRYKNGELVTKEYKDMTEDELLQVDHSNFTQEEEEELCDWIIKKRDEFLEALMI